MPDFIHPEIVRIRLARRSGARTETIARAFGTHSREEINEAVWATLRHEDDREALRHANFVLSHQRAGGQLVNGRTGPAYRRYAPDF